MCCFTEFTDGDDKVPVFICLGNNCKKSCKPLLRYKKETKSTVLSIVTLLSSTQGKILENWLSSAATWIALLCSFFVRFFLPYFLWCCGSTKVNSKNIYATVRIHRLFM